MAATGGLAHSHVTGVENPKRRVLKVQLEKKCNKYKRRMWAQEIHTGLKSH